MLFIGLFSLMIFTAVEIQESMRGRNPASFRLDEAKQYEIYECFSSDAEESWGLNFQMSTNEPDWVNNVAHIRISQKKSDGFFHTVMEKNPVGFSLQIDRIIIIDDNEDPYARIDILTNEAVLSAKAVNKRLPIKFKCDKRLQIEQ